MDDRIVSTGFREGEDEQEPAFAPKACAIISGRRA